MTVDRYSEQGLFADGRRLPLPVGTLRPVAFTLLLDYFAGENDCERKALTLARALPLPVGAWAMTEERLNNLVMRILIAGRKTTT